MTPLQTGNVPLSSITAWPFSAALPLTAEGLVANDNAGNDHLDACGNDGGASRATWLPLPGQDRTGRQTACPKPRAFPLWRHRSGFSTPFLRLDPVGCTVAAPGIQVEHDGLLGLPPR
ncbi:MAG: hypothetical protein OXH01_06720 [Bacteroidetes bacterium]|nr:hypothetical protein [Bacteroidota bacterium]